MRPAALMAAAAALLATGVAMGALQDRLLYFPARAPVESVESVAGGALRAWPAAGDFRGLLAEARAPVRATAVVFHGNAGHAGQRSYYADALAPLQVRTILAEYPGYGPRDGALGEASLVDDAVRTLRAARAQFGGPLLVIGESLGAGVAAAAAGRAPELVDALMLITPWDRLHGVAAHHYPWLPASWLLRDRYDSVASLARFDRPVLVVVAGRDDIVPPRFGQALHDGLTGPKRLRLLPASGHNDWIMATDARWWAGVLDDLLAPAAPR
jgi:pimeloyl-ACP methyl ester carboxylesterase